MVRLYLLLICIFSFGYSKAQFLVSGTILDSLTQEPLSFATIGLQGTTIGTASNQGGNFIVEVPIAYIDSILFVSYMGYKSYFIRVDSVESPVTIELQQDQWLLDEVEVRPWSPWDYIQAALDKVSDNYLSEAFLTTNYYNEYITENGQFLKFTEGVITTYNPAYGDTGRIASKLIQARTRNDLSSIEFMRKRLEKKMTKAVKKAKKKEERIDFETIDEAMTSASFGGPRRILNNDPIRDTATFLNPKNKKYFEYSVKGYSSYFNQRVIIIHFESTRKLNQQKKKGDIYITLDTDAIVVIEFESRLIIPNAVRPIMFVASLGATDPVISMEVHYKPYKDRWYINDISIAGGSHLTHKKMFKKNDKSYFELFQSLITTHVQLENVRPILKEDRLKNWRPLEDQIEPDPEFWENYKVAK